MAPHHHDTSAAPLRGPHASRTPIEHRPPDEVTSVDGRRLAPAGFPAENRAFDVTPAALITAIVTEEGVFRAPYGF